MRKSANPNLMEYYEFDEALAMNYQVVLVRTIDDKTVTMINNAVNVQIIKVSIRGPMEETRPSLAGCLDLAAAKAMAAEPWPASFENRPLLTPQIKVIIKVDPMKPPVAADPVKAS